MRKWYFSQSRQHVRATGVAVRTHKTRRGATRAPSCVFCDTHTRVVKDTMFRVAFLENSDFPQNVYSRCKSPCFTSITLYGHAIDTISYFFLFLRTCCHETSASRNATTSVRPSKLSIFIVYITFTSNFLSLHFCAVFQVRAYALADLFDSD